MTDKLSTMSVRIIQHQLRDPQVGSPCPACSHSINEGDLVVFHPAGAVDCSRNSLTIKGPDAAALYLAALRANLDDELFGGLE